MNREAKDSVNEDWRIVIPAQKLTSHILEELERTRFIWGF
jgi:hypothetical protein